MEGSIATAYPMVPLGEVLTERRELPSSLSLMSGEIPIISKIGFNDGKIQLRNNSQTKTGMILVKPGDIVLSGINAAKGAIAIYEGDRTSPVAATIHYGSYIPSTDKVSSKYLWWLLRSSVFRILLQTYVPGGIKTELKAKRFLPIPVPLPPLAEQRRVVARIEELAAKVEEARGLRAIAKEASRALSHTGVVRALEGVPIDGNLGQVLLEKPRNGWSACCDNADTGIPVLSLKAITGFLYRSNEFKRTSELTVPDAHYWLQAGDLLITRSNTPELVGHAAIYDGSPNPCIYPDLIMKLVVDEEKVDKRFVHYWLKGTSVRDYIVRSAKGTSPTMKKISQGTVMNIPFPISLCLSEQRRIVADLDRLQNETDSLKQLQAETEREIHALLPSILDRAFKGEL